MLLYSTVVLAFLKVCFIHGLDGKLSLDIAIPLT